MKLRADALIARALSALMVAWSILGPDIGQAADNFQERILPFTRRYCTECHNSKTAEAELNLEKDPSSEAAAEDFRQWEHVITFVGREEMPPKAAPQPEPAERAEFLKLLRTILDQEARKLAGDPGLVLPRRLSNAEYDHTIRDLTGVDIHPTRSFPVDPAAGEGFDNTGEALSMSPSLFAKLYSAAQHVADHALLKTDGLEFAPYPVATFADRAMFYEQAILQFYEDHQVDYATYLTACWDYRHRKASDQQITIADWAGRRRLSAKYLQSLYETLQSDPDADRFFLGWIRQAWNRIPGPLDATSPALTNEGKRSIQVLASQIQSLSQRLCPKETEAIISNAGNAPIQHLERRRKTAGERDTFNPRAAQPGQRLHAAIKTANRDRVRISIATQSDGPAAAEGFVILKSINFSSSTDNYRPEDDKRNLSLLKLMANQPPDRLAQLKLGQHPTGAAVEASALVLPIPGQVEIEIPLAEIKDHRNLFLDAELDRANSKLPLALLTIEFPEDSLEKSADFDRRLSATLLVDPGSPVADEITASGRLFCSQFPNRFYFADETRGLSAGFHLIEGFFRDDQPLCKRVLNEAENRELNRLWNELEFVTGITEKMLRGFVFFERSERNFLKHADFDSFKEEDPKLVEPETLNRFERVYLDRSGVKAPLEELTNNPIHVFFDQIRTGLNQRAELLRNAEPTYLENIEQFARRAYRRPLTSEETDDLRAFYRQIASQPDQGAEQAVRASLVRILVSPYFGCRIDPTPEGTAVKPLGDHALASRLSYFLWSSGPDAELLNLAGQGRLQDEDVLIAQTRRMLQDPRVNDFAREFFGQWLGYRHFLDQEAVDRTLFKDFDEPLKIAMFEEPTQFATSLIQNNRAVTELLSSDRTFVNERLARHYGLPFNRGASARSNTSVKSLAGRVDSKTDEQWIEVAGLRGQGRGGILGMAVFLTKNSQPQRTSPVKRGFWVVHKILGEHIPAPPADVVALPAKETDTNGKTIRELLAMHVESEKCGRCHRRFDSVGLSMEGFDPIGRSRTKDLAGRPIDNLVKLPDGSEARGVDDFSQRLVVERRADFIGTLCRKLLGYALGRSLQLSDEVLLEEMHLALDKNGDRFVPLFESIVRSPQFRRQRCRDFSTASFRIQNQGENR